MKDIISRLKSLPIPRLLKNKYVLTGLLFFLWLLLFDPINLIDWAGEKYNLRKLKKERKLLEQNIDIVSKNIEAFSNPDSLEKVAREQFYFRADGEETFIIE